MNQDALNQKAKDIIKENIYLSLGTADVNPWVSALFWRVYHMPHQISLELMEIQRLNHQHYLVFQTLSYSLWMIIHKYYGASSAMYVSILLDFCMFQTLKIFT